MNQARYMVQRFIDGQWLDHVKFIDGHLDDALRYCDEQVVGRRRILNLAGWPAINDEVVREWPKN